MKQLWKSLSIAGAAFSVTVAGAAQAAPDSTLINQLNTYGQEGRTDVGQVNSVFQLRDVAPSDWAFDALRNLVEKYNCIAGYPNGTFRGNRPLSRYEFAAGLNACLQQIERLVIGSSDGSEIATADIARLRALVQEFDAELATLGARVDDLEGRVEFLEDNQFSTTTQLEGEVVFGLSDSFGDTSSTDGSDDDTTETVFNNRVRLTLATSFTGKDTLITRLTAGNNQGLAPAGGVGVQTYDLANGNDVVIDWLAYYFPIKKANAYLAAWGGLHSDYTSTTFGANGLEDFTGASGSLTFNAASSPIYLIGGGGGFGLNFPAGPVDISLGYLADDSSSPAQGSGLFNGQYGALAQLALNLGSKAELGVTYVNSFQNGALFDFGGGSPLTGTAATAALGTTEANTFGLQGKFDVTDKVSLAAYGLYSDVGISGSSADEEIWSYGAGVAFNDVGKEGNVVGIFAGAPPYVGGSTTGSTVDGGDTPFQLEGFYKYQLNDGISITPGVIWLSNPNEGAGNEDNAVIGTLRTTFKF